MAIAGPVGGGAILAGSGNEPGLTLATGALNNLEFESFMVAVVSTGKAAVSNARARLCGTAIRLERFRAPVAVADNFSINSGWSLQR